MLTYQLVSSIVVLVFFQISCLFLKFNVGHFDAQLCVGFKHFPELSPFLPDFVDEIGKKNFKS